MTCMGEWRYCSTVLDLGIRQRSGQLHAPGTHWIGGWVGPRAGLDDTENRTSLNLSEFELWPLGRPASRYTDWAITWTIQRRMVEWLMNWRGFRRKLSCPERDITPAYACSGWRKPCKFCWDSRCHLASVEYKSSALASSKLLFRISQYWTIACWICGSHSSDYEEYGRFGCEDPSARRKTPLGIKASLESSNNQAYFQSLFVS
jgi:hypothetical protein